MDISVIICTYNRSQNLNDCFACLNQQILIEPLTWEIILIDNNSSDDTKEIVSQSSKHSNLNIRYVFESEQGLSAARNRGIKETTGTYLVFIDDDIRVTKNWLQTIYTTFKKFDCDAVGGRIHIEVTESLPKWITSDMYGFLGYQDFGPTPHYMDGINEFPFGGNMAVHRRVIDLIGDFDVNMGRKGDGLKKDELFKGEETDFFHRLAAAGGKFYYHPDALVLHLTLPHQLKTKFFLTLHNNAGILEATLDNHSYSRQFLGIPFYIFPQFLRAMTRWFYQILTSGYNRSFRQLMTLSYFWGMMSGYYKK